jgi:hypothetical protein
MVRNVFIGESKLVTDKLLSRKFICKHLLHAVSENQYTLQKVSEKFFMFLLILLILHIEIPNQNKVHVDTITSSENNQHYALNCNTPLFNIQASTCFGSGLPSSGIFLNSSELLEMQIE